SRFRNCDAHPDSRSRAKNIAPASTARDACRSPKGTPASWVRQPSALSACRGFFRLESRRLTAFRLRGRGLTRPLVADETGRFRSFTLLRRFGCVLRVPALRCGALRFDTDCELLPADPRLLQLSEDFPGHALGQVDGRVVVMNFDAAD